MKKYFLIIWFTLNGFGLIGLTAQNKPSATILTPDTAFCAKAGNVDMVIKFSGTPPFGLIYTRYVNGIPNGTTFRNKAVDGIPVLNTDTTFTITLTAQDIITTQYKVDEVFDKSIIQVNDGDGAYWKIGSGTTYCYGDLDIRVDKMPNPNAGNDTAVCDYFSVLKGKSSIANSQLTWSTTSAGVTFDNPNIANPVVTVPTQNDYIFKLKEVNLKCSNETVVNYRFHGFAEATLSGQTEICEVGDVITILETTGNYPITYTCKDVSTNIVVTPPIEVNGATFNGTIAANGNQTFKLNSVVDKYGCVTPQLNLLGNAKSINVKPYPVMPKNDTVCSNFSAISVQSTLGIGNWSGAGNFDDVNAISTKYTIPTLPTIGWGKNTLSWTEKYAEWCTTTVSYDIEFQKEPNAYAGLDSILFLDTELILQANDPEFGIGKWTSSNPLVNIANINSYNTLVTNLPYEKVRLTWTVENGLCPSASDYIDVLVKGFTYTNGFTPNGDGINDYFEIFGLLQRPILNNELKVFDAVGRLVYSEKDYKNSWDGTDFKGTQLPTGAYYYQFSGDGIEAVQSYLIIKRE